MFFLNRDREAGQRLKEKCGKLWEILEEGLQNPTENLRQGLIFGKTGNKIGVCKKKGNKPGGMGQNLSTLSCEASGITQVFDPGHRISTQNSKE